MRRPVDAVRPAAATTKSRRRPATRTRRSRPSGSSASTAASEVNGVGPSGSMWSRLSDSTGTRPNVSNSGPSSRSGARIAVRGLVLGEDSAIDHHELPAAQELRKLRQRWQVEDPERGGDLVRRVDRPLRPAPQHRVGVLAVPNQHSGVAVLNSNIGNSSAVTTPKLPPPPRSAQKTSRWCPCRPA